MNKTKLSIRKTITEILCIAGILAVFLFIATFLPAIVDKFLSIIYGG